MSEFLNRIAKLSAKQLMVLADELNTRIEKMGRAASQPIAVIGVGCRFPGGADSPADFRRLLGEGRDAIREVPPQRWEIERFYDPDPDRPGKMNTRWGGFLEGIEGFDAEFFGISPREAISMDPQQRLALEVAWETIEDAGISPLALAGSRTGVYLGLCNADYSKLVMDQSVAAIDAYMATGSAHSIAAGRISYLLNLEGPSIALDTACSSSLVAVHLACQSLRAGECRMALAGGVNLILMPETTVALSKAHMMSPHGRCKAFDQAADGFVRGEGCGMVALKRLADAQADGDPIQGLILGSAVNQDGRSGGITAPNGPSQVDVIRKALHSAALAPSAVGYIEAHGTGTILGDPIEMRALGEVFGQGRDPRQPLWVGSVKTNIGHGESAAGIAGLIKALLAVRFGEIPPHLHFATPNVEIDWPHLPLRIPTQRVVWEDDGRPRVAGVSSFGFSGTNAHVVIGQAPPAAAAEPARTQAPRLITLSAKEGRALAEWAGRYADCLGRPPAPALDTLSRTLNAGRSHFGERAAFMADSVSDARAKLESIARNGESPGVMRSRQTVKRPARVVFMFTGQGAQYLDMGRALYQAQPIFRRTLDQCAQLLQPVMDRPLQDLLFAPEAAESPLAQTAYAQPALFALEYALAAQWRFWGVEPAALLGHSVGEYVAACVAGIFSLEEGLRLIARRGQLMQGLATAGQMAAVAAPAETVQAMIEANGPGVCIAGLNGPGQTVVSGEPESVQRLLEKLAAQGVGVHPLKVTRAFHSHLMEPVLAALEAEAGRIAFKAPQIPIAANLTGALAQASLMTQATYWRDHSRQPVRFAECVRALHGAGYRHFLEIGPHPVLSLLGPDCLGDPQVNWYHTLRRGHDDPREILQCLGELYVNGVPIDWRQVEAPPAGPRMALPTYPFQRRDYWLAPAAPRQAQIPAQIEQAGHPLLGRELVSPCLADRVFETWLSCDRPRFLRQHRIFGHWIMPTPAYLEMALAAAEAAGLHDPAGHGGWCLGEVQIQEALLLPESNAVRVQTVISAPSAAVGRECRFYSAAPSAGGLAWRQHAVCRILPVSGAETPQPALSLSALKERCPREISVETYYQGVQSLGLEFGPAFRGLQRIWKGDGEALGQIVLPAELEPEYSSYRIHPALLDACFHLLGAALPEETSDHPFLLIGIGQVRLFRRPPKRFWNLTRLHVAGDAQRGSFSGDITLFDENGEVIALYSNLLLRKTRGDALAAVARPRVEAQWLYRLDWVPRPLPTAARSAASAPLLPPADMARRLSADLKRYGDESGLWVYGELLPELDRWCYAAIVRAMHRMQAGPIIVQWFAPADLARALQVLPRYGRLLHRLCDILAADGYLCKQGERFRIAAEPPGAAAPPQPQVLLQQFPSCRTEIEMTVRCGEHLDEVLTGARDPLELIFPRAEVQAAEQIYENSPYARTYNASLADAVASEAAARHAAGEAVRILEIGGGTGGTTTHVLKRLDARQDHYVFSDISPLFVVRAREKYSAYGNIDCRVLDIEAAPEVQGFAAGERFDIVIAANVLHATVNLKEALERIRRLLTPDGLLVLLEGTAPQRWVDLTFGLTEGWWRFQDTDLRPSYPLIDRRQWHDLLTGCGYECALAGVDDPRWSADIFNQTVIVARRPPTDADGPKIQGTWLLWPDPHGVDQALARQLEAAGASVIRAAYPSGVEDVPGGPAGWLKKMMAQPGRDADQDLQGIIYFAQGSAAGQSLGDPWVAPDVLVVLELMQGLCAAGTTGKLWICTRGGQATQAADGALHPEQAALWGLSRVFSLEHPALFGGIVDLPASGPAEATAALLCAHISTAGDEDQAVLRDGRCLVPRIIRGEPEVIPEQPVHLRREAAYLITGGLGGLGLQIADWLAGQGAGRLILAARKTVPDRAQWAQLPPDSEMAGVVRAIRALEAKGAEVHTVSVDVGDRQAMTALFEALGRDTARPLKGIVHAAVEMSGAAIEHLTPVMIARMFRAKVGGALLLDELSRDLNLAFFVLFSSTTALWGVAGLAHYAAANQVLDILAHQRRRAGRPALSINWGTWEQMRVASRAEQEKFRQAGLEPMPAGPALALMGRLAGTAAAQLCVAAVDWERLRSLYEVRRPRPIFRLISSAPAAPQRPAAAASAEGLTQRLTALPVGRRHDALVAHIQARVREVLRLAPDMAVDSEKGFFDMGMDSLMAIELKSRLQTDMAMSLPSTLTFNYPTIEEVAGFLAKQLAPATASVMPPKAEATLAPDATKSSKADTLSEDELSELLIRKLQELK